MSRMLLKREGHHVFGGYTTLSSQPHSDITFSGSASSDKQVYMALSPKLNFQLQSRLYGSTGASTSGRLATGSAPDTVVPLFWGDFVSSLYSQSLDNDAPVRFQIERLQSGMEVLKRKHCGELMSMVEQQAVKRLRVKEVELEKVKKKNRELEEQVTQMSAECQILFNYAKTTDAVASSLRAKLDQVLTNKIACPAIDFEENCSSSSGDAESVCGGDDSRRTCRVCREREVCVLLLPCRHLCLCKGCEASIDTCPLCNSTRNASIQVLVP